MFERFTQGARRVIFFARYEASQYGSRFIETEHLLLGLFREGHSLVAKWFPGETDVEAAIRTEIEKRITPRERISTSVEVPVSAECKILRVETSVAAEILSAHGLKPGPVIERFAKAPQQRNLSDDKASALPTLESFLSGLKSLNTENLISFFAKKAQVIDSSGKQWNRDEIWKTFETLFAPYGKKNASYVVEATLADTRELCVASIRWNNALLASEQRAWMHRMSVVLVFGTDDWEILLLQVTPLDVAASRQTSGTDTAR